MRGFGFGVASAVAASALGLAVQGCEGPENATAHSDLRPEIGFVELPGDVATFDGQQLVSPPTRLFYALRPARDDQDAAPLVVVHAGGPGASVLNLAAYGTAAHVLGSDGTLVENRGALANVHLLYLDARQAGFSYSELEDPSDGEARAAAFTAAGFNPYRDATDLLLVLFELLDRYPSLQQRPIFLLGESYAALRSNVMFHLLLHAEEYGNGSERFQSPTLSRVLRERFRSVFDDESPSPAVITSWFRGQILLQPWFAGIRQANITGALLEQQGSPLDELATETDTDYQRCESEADCDPYDNARRFLVDIDRSAYDIRETADWSLRNAEHLTAVATSSEALAAVLDVTLDSLDATFDVARAQAYRFADVRLQWTPRETGDLDSRWGTLEPWDAYFLIANEEVLRAFTSSEAQSLGLDPNQEWYGNLLADNLRAVPTMMTRAEQDLVIYGPAIAPTLASYPGVREVIEGNSGQGLSVVYDDGLVVSVMAPRYSQCSHSVLRDQPQLVLDDISRFIAEVPER